MKVMKGLLSSAATLALLISAPVAMAHSQWLLPSTTQVAVSSNPQRPAYVSVDAASSNGLFYADHNAMRLTNLKITGPDGAAVEPENANTARYRSTFDVKLEKPGTYRIASASRSVSATYKLAGEDKTFRGTEETLAGGIPAEATDVKISRSFGRVETFVVAGAPSELTPVGEGLELFPLQPVTDLVIGEKARFRVLFNGQPVPNLKVKVVPGGVRYRGELGDEILTADANGEVSVDWKLAGPYWLNASYPPRPEEDDDDDHGPQQPRPAAGAAGAPAAAASTAPAAPQRREAAPLRASYSGTFEVLPY
ncbi:MAG: DUF4198 domain-containing protein [Asticcacaulis sp.]